MRISQTFRKDTSSDSDSKLSISLNEIDKNTKLEDVLKEVENIYSTHFSD
jgi:hypothetical protein